MFMFDWRSGWRASLNCWGMWWDLSSANLKQSISICLIVNSTLHFAYRTIGESFLAMRWLCVAKVCSIRRWLKMVSSFLFKPGFFHTWILFFIVFNLVFCLVQWCCHFWYRTFWVSFFKSVKVLRLRIWVSVDEAALDASWSASSLPSTPQCPAIHRKDIFIPFWLAT